MNDTPAPLTTDEVDELLSAELDDEFDAAARDLGFEPAAARERLAASPAVEARRQALTAARDALAQTPALDEVTAARLRTTTLAEFPVSGSPTAATSGEPHPRRLWLLAGSVAAGLALVVGLGLALRGSHGDNAKTAAAAGRAAPTTVHNSAAGVSSTANGKQTESADASAGVAYAQTLGTFADVDALAGHLASTPRTVFAPATLASGSAKRATTTRCAATFGHLDPGDEVVLSGAATVAGQPVTAYVFAHGTDQVLVVVNAECRLVGVRSIPSPRG